MIKLKKKNKILNIKKIDFTDKIISLLKDGFIIVNKKDKQYVSSKLLKIPLYNIRSNEIEFVKKNKIYEYTLDKDYRFIFDTKKFPILKNFIEKKIEKNYNESIVNVVLSDISTCPNHSVFQFQKNKKPYFIKRALMPLAHNLGIKKYNEKNVCSKIAEKTFSKNVILEHADHVQKNKGIYAIRFYSFNGYIYINKYLRNLSRKQKKNLLLEKNIVNLWNLIKTAPAFEKEYSIFRMIDDDSFLDDLEEGDIFESQSFISCTRDPFYVTDELSSSFGDVIIKINIPKGKKGCALLLELFSYFPEEEEILLAPRTRLKLVNKNWKYKHYNEKVQNNIRSTYEFDLIDNLPIEFTDVYNPLIKKIPVLDFDKLEPLSGNTIDDKIVEFKQNYTNISQFKYNSKDKKEEYHFYIRFYNSEDIYQEYYKFKLQKGLAINLQNQKNSQICVVIEIYTIIYVNYKMNLFNGDDCGIMKDEHLINFLIGLSKLFNIKKIVINTNSNSCVKFDKSKSIYDQYHNFKNNYVVDIYQYLKNKKIRFSDIKTPKIINNFDNLDILFNMEVPSIFHHKKIYKKFIKENKNNMANFYVYLIENKCYKMDEYIIQMYSYLNKINRFNLFENIRYVIEL